jgi:hypothetical protein
MSRGMDSSTVPVLAVGARGLDREGNPFGDSQLTRGASALLGSYPDP